VRPSRGPRALSPRQVKWLLNLFPPWLLQGIRIVEISPDFLRATVRVRRGLLTGNLNGSTFGGTLFAAFDPVCAILYWQILAHRGLRVQAWLRSASIRYVRPAKTALTLHFEIGEADVEDAVAALGREGRFARSYHLVATDTAGLVCAEAETEVYLRLPRAGQKEVSAF
jgi:acyl-coenzyme A thioesterase PaaI-like protein